MAVSQEAWDLLQSVLKEVDGGDEVQLSDSENDFVADLEARDWDDRFEARLTEKQILWLNTIARKLGVE